MLVVRGTKKLRDRVKMPSGASDDESTTVLGDWFATALFWRPHVALFVNQRTFLPMFLPLAPASTVLLRAPEAIADVLRLHGADESFVAAELAAMSDVRIAPTNDRSVVGVMNEYAFHGELRRNMEGLDFDELSVGLADMPLGPLRNRAGSADRELAVALGMDTGKVVPFPADRAATRSAGTDTADVFQLKVTLVGTKPPIWRRLLVDGSTTLHEFHKVIQAAFGWWNYHLYDFEFGRARYGIPDPDWDMGPPTRDARGTQLNAVATPGASFTYTYDFGDDWRLKITVEQILRASPELTVPSCTGGRRAGPPEDCGGVWGYQELLSILADPTHDQHDERREWMAGMGDGEFDPDRFEPGEFADNLRHIDLATFDD